MLGDKTRSRGTPLPVAIVQQPAANFIRNHFHIRSHVPAASITGAQTGLTSPSFYIDEAGEGGNPFSLLGCILDFPLPLHPVPRNRRYSQTGRERSAVEI